MSRHSSWCLDNATGELLIDQFSLKAVVCLVRIRTLDVQRLCLALEDLKRLDGTVLIPTVRSCALTTSAS